MVSPAQEGCQATAKPLQTPGSGQVHHYAAYGLHIASTVKLPQLSPTEPATPDLTIAFDAVEDGPRISRPGYRRGFVGDQFRYEIQDGSLIVVDPMPAARDENVSDLIMSRVLTAAIYQRGLLPLHASAVMTAAGLVVLSGPSGAGKSTLAGLLAARGGQLIGDDMIVLGPDGRVRGCGAAGLKLTERSLTRLGRTSAGLDMANTVESKFFLPVERVAEQDAPVATFVQLRHGEFAIRPLSVVEALAGSKACIRMLDLLPEAPDEKVLWGSWLKLVTGTTNLSVSHGERMDALDAIADRLEERT